VVLTLVRLVNRTSEDVVRKHWSGGGDIVALIDSVVSIAPAFLPKRVKRVLEARVELAPAGQIIGNITDRGQPIVVEVAESKHLSDLERERESRLSPLSPST
jgi:hypothetical protein